MVIKPITKYQTADGSTFDTEEEAKEYIVKRLSNISINKIEPHNFKVGDILY